MNYALLLQSIKHTIILIVCSVFSYCVYAQKPVQLPVKGQYFEVVNEYLFTSYEGGFFHSDRFTEHDLNKISFITPNTPFYGKFILTTDTRTPEILLEFPDNKISEVTIEVYSNGSLNKIYSDSSRLSYGFGDRMFFHKNHVFKLPPLSVGQHIVCYRVKSLSSMYPFIWIKHSHQLVNSSVPEYTWYGFFYGTAIVMCLLNLFLYLFTRQVSFLFYSFYVLFTGLYMMSYNGTGYQFLWNHSPTLDQHVYRFFSAVMVLFHLAYVRTFFDSGNTMTVRIHWSLIMFGVFRLIVLLIMWALPKWSVWYLLIDAIPLFFGFMLGVYLYTKGVVFARLYVWGMFFLLTGYVIFLLAFYHLIPTNFFTYNALFMGACVEFVFLTAAFSDQYRWQQLQKEYSTKQALLSMEENKQLQSQLLDEALVRQKLSDKINAELETKVKERTEELHLALAQVEQWSKKWENISKELDVQNWNLKKSVQEEKKATWVSRDMTVDQFKEVFKDESAVLNYLSNLKWERGYQCRKCRNTNYVSGNQPFSKKCTKCKYEESAIAHTILQGVRFPLDKAMYIIQQSYIHRDNKPSTEISKDLQLRDATGWAFRKKVLAHLDQIKSNDIHRILGL